MQAAVFERYGSVDQLTLREVPPPEPRAGEVRVRVRAASANDWDAALLGGSPWFLRPMMLGLWRPRENLRIPGVDVAGEVDAVGDGVTHPSVGDAVFADLSGAGFGAFAEQVCVPAEQLEVMPTTMSFEQAAGVPHAALLFLQVLRDEAPELRPGQHVLLNGAGGGVGTYAVQVLTRRDVEVTAVDRGDKLAMLTELGADHVIDYTREDFTRRGVEYDLIIDTRTNRGPLAYARALKPGGHYVTVGGSMTRMLQLMALRGWIARTRERHLRILSLVPNKYLAEMRHLIDAEGIVTVVDGPYPLRDVREALAHFGRADHRGKVIVSVS